MQFGNIVDGWQSINRAYSADSGNGPVYRGMRIVAMASMYRWLQRGFVALWLVINHVPG